MRKILSNKKRSARHLSLVIAFLLLFISSRVFAYANAPDINQDTCVDASDVSLLKAVFRVVSPSYGDSNGDGKVTSIDLAKMMASWTPSCTPATASVLQYAYQGDWDSSSAPYIASHYGLIITKEDTAGITQMRQAATAAGKDPLIVHYFKFAGEHGPLSDPAQTASYWSAYTQSRWRGPSTTQETYIRAGNNWYYADLGDDTKRANFLSIVTSPSYSDSLYSFFHNQDIDGFFFDNSSLLTAGDVYEKTESGTTISSGDALINSLVPYGTNKEPYWNGKYNFIDGVKKANGMAGVKIFANNYYNKTNFTTLLPGHDQLEFLQVADGIMRESAFWEEVSAGSSWRPLFGDKAALTIQKLSQAALDKKIILYNYGPLTDTQARLYSLGGSLMITKGNVVHFYGPTLGTPYTYPEYTAIQELGSPTGNYVQNGNIFTRDFQNGKVVMNVDTTATASYTIPAGTWTKLTVSGGGAWNGPAGTFSWDAVAAGSVQTITNPGALILKKP